MAALYRALHISPALDLHVHHVMPFTADRPWKSSFTSGYNERSFRTRIGLDWELIRRVMGEKDSYFVFACWGDPTNQLCMLLAWALGRRYAIWNDAPDPGRPRNIFKSALRALFLTLVFRPAHAVMGPGEPALNLIAEMGCPRDKLVNLPYFVDVDEFVPRLPARPHRDTPIVFTSIGRLSAEKQFGTALDALAQVFHHDRGGFRYRIAGTGPELERLRAQAASLGIADRVSFLGWLEPTECRDVLQSTDVLLHPARFEPYGLVILEAMASAVTVIASDTTYAALDRIRTGENGFVYERGNLAQLCGIIRQIVEDRDSLRVIGRAARRTAEQWPVSRGVEILLNVLVRH